MRIFIMLDKGDVMDDFEDVKQAILETTIPKPRITVLTQEAGLAEQLLLSVKGKVTEGVN